jgi:lactoylglutathione lyase
MKDRGDEEDKMNDTMKTQITDVGVVGIPVGDQDRALEFYVGTLGFETRLDVPMPGGGRWIMVAPAGATTMIALVAASDRVPAGGETGIRFTTADADADWAYLRASGVDADDVLRWPGVPAMFAVRDQDGNGFEIVEAA